MFDTTASGLKGLTGSPPQTAPQGRREEKEERRRKRRSNVYFFLLNRLKRFSLSFSRLPGLDSAVVVATAAGIVCARAAGAGVLWLLGVTSGLSPEMALEMVEIHEFISSWKETSESFLKKRIFKKEMWLITGFTHV